MCLSKCNCFFFCLSFLSSHLKHLGRRDHSKHFLALTALPAKTWLRWSDRSMHFCCCCIRIYHWANRKSRKERKERNSIVALRKVALSKFHDQPTSCASQLCHAIMLCRPWYQSSDVEMVQTSEAVGWQAEAAGCHVAPARARRSLSSSGHDETRFRLLRD
ncbi:hypothetical protein HDK64DRAFT_271646 [Phyllosticta capitalensis]